MHRSSFGGCLSEEVVSASSDLFLFPRILQPRSCYDPVEARNVPPTDDAGNGAHILDVIHPTCAAKFSGIQGRAETIGAGNNRVALCSE